MAYADDASAPDDDIPEKLVFSDDELMGFVREERRRSIGFGEGDAGELTTARETALAYYKGDMVNVSSDWRVPSLENRSKAVDTTVADAIETVLPDVLEVFVGGDDVASFIANGESDEDQARDESDYLNHVIWVDNPGFVNFYTACKDALLLRTGLFHWYPEVCEDEQDMGEVPAELADAAKAAAEQQGLKVGAEERQDGSVMLTQTNTTLRVCIKSVPPEDFSVAPDTVSLKDATYCVMRDRPRVQELIARGVDAEVARSLRTYTFSNERIELARDEAGEHDRPIEGSLGDLRIVEVRAHYLRVDADGDGTPELWRIVTDAEERVFIEKERVSQVPFAALTPYIVAHRFYGESVADKLLDVQKIKTALLRMLLDSGYFAHNQRSVVAMDLANEFTLSDLLRNVPGSPIRARAQGAVEPMEAGQLNFNPLEALEYGATMAEGRSGIVRNAQGLNPNTLHDTATGAVALMNAAQKRVRMIARIFAETGVKDLYLGVHAMLRSSYQEGYRPLTAKLRRSWKQIKPSEWPEREAMAIHVGVGSGGKDHDLLLATQRLNLTKEAIAVPGAQAVLDPGNIYAQLMAFERAAGSKDGDRYWSDPSSPEAQQRVQQAQQQPNPEMAKVQAQAQAAQQQAQLGAQIEQQKAQAKAQADQLSAQNDLQIQMAKMKAETDLRREEMQQKMQLEREKAAQQLELQRQEMLATVALKREEMRMRASTSTDVDDAVEELPG